MSWRETSVARVWLVVGTVCAILLVIAWLGAARAAAFGGEFANPSPNGPPAVSAYNTAPASCATKTKPYCEIDAPSPSLPPADANSPETYLNSAYWPAEERPDVEIYAIQQYGYNYQNCSDPSTWNHYCFLVDAEAVGYPVTHTPQVGDLFLARCENFIDVDGNPATNCPLGNIYYIGYVEQVLSDGSFIVTEGGAGPNDSGIAFDWLSGSMDANSDFIGFFPPGQAPHLPPVQVKVYYSGDYGTWDPGGVGTVTDSNGQTCHFVGPSPDCLFTEPQGVPVTFTATPAAGSTFQGFTSCATGTGPTCAYTFSGRYGEIGGDVGADFELSNPTSPSTGGGSGSGGTGGITGVSSTTGTAILGRPRIAGMTADVPISCAGGTRRTCSVTLTLTVTETIKNGKLIAVMAAKRTKTTVTKRVVVLGTASVKLSGGQRKIVQVRLNGVGRRLLAADHSLKVKLALRQSGRTVSRAITFRLKPSKHKKK